MTHRFCEVPTVTIFVGKDRKPFYVHQEQLCEVSSFFKAAFTSGFREASEQTMELVEEDEDTFDRFIQWLYSQQYEMPGEKAEGGGEFMEPLKLFVLGEKYDVSKLKDLLMTRLFARGKLTGSPPQLAGIAYVYENTPTNSKVRKLLADWYACKVSLSWYKGDVAQRWFGEHPDFMMDVMLSFVNHTSRQHQHNPFKCEMPEDYKDKDSQAE